MYNKKSKQISRFFIIITFIVIVSTFYSVPAASESVSDLYRTVIGKLKFEPSIDESDITIAIKDNGIVVLGGKVESYAEKRLAEEAVKTIKGVKGVANEIEVELSLHYKQSDADIVESALSVLKWTVLVPHEKIQVVVDKGNLTLSGEVEYNYQKECAQEIVSDLYGITSITNNIIIKSSISPSEVKSKILEEFERNARIDANNVQVEVDGSRVTLKGIVKNFDEGDEAVDAAWSIPGVTDVIDQLEISW